MAGSALLNSVMTATGSVEKATIWIRDERELLKKGIVKSGASGYVSSKGVGMLAAASTLTSYTPSVLDGVTNAIKSAVGIDLTSKKIKRLQKGGYNRSIPVQFNPTSLRISGRGGDDDVQINNYTQAGRGIGRGAMGFQIELSLNLIFDQVSNTAAFQQDMLTLSSSRAVSSAANIVNEVALGRKTQSVQVVVEAFIAALRSDKTRMLCFEWGEMMYEGMLRTVNTEYTMFDINGNPVRASVGLLLCLIESTEDGLRDYSNRYWYQAYYDAFIKGNPAAEKMTRLAKKPVAK
jgi:hypothetical protein